MKSPNLLGAAALACSALVMAAPAYAHHSFAAEWDSTKCRDFTGVLRKLDWQNPHPYFFVDVKENGKVEQWSFQAYSPVTLRRNGTDRQVVSRQHRQGRLDQGLSVEDRQATRRRCGHVEVLGRRDAAGRSDPGLRR